jgi:hypothetical protein
MSEGPHILGKFSIRQIMGCIFWVSLGLAMTRGAFVLGASQQDVPNSSAYWLVWIAVLAGGASIGGAIGEFAGHRLLWAIAGIFAWPIALITIWNYFRLD